MRVVPIALAILLGGLPVLAAEGAGEAPPASPKAGAGDQELALAQRARAAAVLRSNPIMVRLGLTEEQAEKILSAFMGQEAKLAAAIKELREQGNGQAPGPEAMAAYEKKRKELDGEFDAKIREILNDEQKAKLDAGRKVMEGFMEKSKKMQEEVGAAYRAAAADPEKAKEAAKNFREKSKALMDEVGQALDEKIGKPLSLPKAFAPQPESSPAKPTAPAATAPKQSGADAQ
jgi:hypothetical protein